MESVGGARLSRTAQSVWSDRVQSVRSVTTSRQFTLFVSVGSGKPTDQSFGSVSSVGRENTTSSTVMAGQVGSGRTVHLDPSDGRVVRMGRVTQATVILIGRAKFY